MGYDVLFHSEPWFDFIPTSPFGFLLGSAEVAVLIWTSAVIRDWSHTSRILKLVIWLLVPAFSFLCYSGINSYLSTLATSEIRKVQEVKVKASNNEDYLSELKVEAQSLDSRISVLTSSVSTLNSQINEKNSQIQDLSKQASERRLKATDCSLVADCASSVEAFDNQIKLIGLDINQLNKTREKTNQRITESEEQLDIIRNEIRELKASDRKNKNEFAGTESKYEMKKAAYEGIVLTVTSWFGYKPEDPFSVFVGFISFLIYPVYFILNLFLALNSPENKARRKLRLSQKKERKSIRNYLFPAIYKIFRARILRKKKNGLTKLSESIKLKAAKKSRRELLYKKLLRYLRVWAHRRKKIKEISLETVREVETVVEREVEKVIEVEVPIEREIEVVKEVPVEVRIEVPVEVDKIVEVPTEVPVYVEKIKKIPEPVFIKDPQVIIHERVVPVPEDVTAEELERILNAQPRLNADARDSEKSVVIQSQEERPDQAANSDDGKAA